MEALKLRKLKQLVFLLPLLRRYVLITFIYLLLTLFCALVTILLKVSSTCIYRGSLLFTQLYSLWFELSMVKLLVFGGNGFVGSHICKEALERGLTVASISRYGFHFPLSTISMQVDRISGFNFVLILATSL